MSSDTNSRVYLKVVVRLHVFRYEGILSSMSLPLLGNMIWIMENYSIRKEGTITISHILQFYVITSKDNTDFDTSLSYNKFFLWYLSAFLTVCRPKMVAKIKKGFSIRKFIIQWSSPKMLKLTFIDLLRKRTKNKFFRVILKLLVNQTDKTDGLSFESLQQRKREDDK